MLWILSPQALLVKLSWCECHRTKFDNKSLFQIMAWCRQAVSHYLSQCWPISVSSYGVTRPQRVNTLRPEQNDWQFWHLQICLMKAIMQLKINLNELIGTKDKFWWHSSAKCICITGPQWVKLYCVFFHHGDHIDGLMQERCNPIANTLELHLSCINPSLCYPMQNYHIKFTLHFHKWCYQQKSRVSTLWLGTHDPLY